MTPPPSHTLSPIAMGFAASHFSRRGSGSTGWVGVSSCTFGPDLDVVADGDARDVESDQAVVDEAASADGDLVPVVHVQRRADLAVRSDRPEQRSEEPGAQRTLSDRGGVVGGYEVLRDAELLGDLGVGGDVRIAGEHPLPHRAGVQSVVRAVMAPPYVLPHVAGPRRDL